MMERLTAATAAIAMAFVAALMIAQPTPSPAQPAGQKNLFSTLKVGQMIEVGFDDQSTGYAIRTYDDPAQKPRMAYKVTEIHESFLAVQLAETPTPGESWDLRIPTHSVMAIFHVKKARKGK